MPSGSVVVLAAPPPLQASLFLNGGANDDDLSDSSDFDSAHSSSTPPLPAPPVGSSTLKHRQRSGTAPSGSFSYYNQLGARTDAVLATFERRDAMSEVEVSTFAMPIYAIPLVPQRAPPPAPPSLPARRRRSSLTSTSSNSVVFDEALFQHVLYEHSLLALSEHEEARQNRAGQVILNGVRQTRVDNCVVFGDNNELLGDNLLVIGNRNVVRGDNNRARGADNRLYGRCCTNYDTGGDGVSAGPFSAHATTQSSTGATPRAQTHRELGGGADSSQSSSSSSFDPALLAQALQRSESHETNLRGRAVAAADSKARRRRRKKPTTNAKK